MRFHRLASLAMFTSTRTAALPSRADVAPACEDCILHDEGDGCDNHTTGKPGVCTTVEGEPCAQCLPAPADPGTNGGDAGTTGGTESGGGCSTAGAVGASWAIWGIAAVPLLLRRRRAKSQRGSHAIVTRTRRRSRA